MWFPSLVNKKESMIEIIRTLENWSSKERLRKLALFSLEKGSLRRDFIALYTYLKGG